MDIATKMRSYKRDRSGYAEYCHQAADEIDRLRQVARNVYEVWAGSEGIPMPETAAEAYLLQLVEQMRDEAKNGLHNLFSSSLSTDNSPDPSKVTDNNNE